MKKALFFISALAILAGCAKDSISVADPENNTISAYISDVPATKTRLIDNPTQKISSSWTAGDQIGVFGTGAANLQLTLSKEDLSTNAKTAKFRADASVPSGSLFAYFPYSASAGNGSSGSVSLNFPDKQKYCLERGFPQPDPDAHFMVADGSKTNGLTFRNAFAYIKGGQTFEKETVISKIEFRDLSGATVCGPFKMSWANGRPQTEFTGSGKVITLECDNLKVAEGKTMKFFITVPARNYAQGFEITFITDKGEKIVKTAAKSGGKNLDAGVAYLVGDADVPDPIADSKTVFNDGVVMFSPEMLSRCETVSMDSYQASDADGKPMTIYGQPVNIYDMQLFMPNEFNVTQGGWIIVETPTEMLPLGGIFKIESVKAIDSQRQLVHIKTEQNVAAPFKEAHLGSEDAGVDVDIANYISEIVDENGESVPFTIGEDGNLLFDKELVESLLGEEIKAPTKAVHSASFPFPEASLTMKAGHAALTLGAKMTLSTKLAFGMSQGELQYIKLNLSPELDLKAGFAYDLSPQNNSKGWSKHLFTLKTTGVMVAPGVYVYFEFVLSAIAGAELSIQMSADVSFHADLGTYALAYNRGNGVTLNKVRDPYYTLSEPEFNFDAVMGSVSAKAGLRLSSACNIYGLCGIGLETDACLKASMEVGLLGQNKLKIGPDLSFTPKFTAIGGYYTHRFEDFSFSLDLEPLWERCIIPARTHNSVSVKKIYSSPLEVPMGESNWQFNAGIPCGMEGFEYDIGVAGASIVPTDLCLDIYTGSDLTMTPTYIAADEGELCKQLEANGCAHLKPYATSLLSYDLKNPTLIERVVLATFKQNDEGEVVDSLHIKGLYPYSTPSGVPIGAQVSFSYGGIDNYVVKIENAFRYNPYNAFIYYWPYRSNGQPYRRQSTEE